jgi:hypothetical protein
MKNIFFIEFAKDVSLINKYFEQDDILIALSAEAASELDQRKIKYKTLQENYYSHKDYIKIVKDLEEQLIEIINNFDYALENFDEKFKKTNIKPFYRFIYFFKFLFDSIRVKIFELNNLFQMEEINKVKFFKVYNEPINQFYHYFDSDSIYQLLLKDMSKKYKFRIVEIEVGNKTVKKASLKSFIIKYIRLLKIKNNISLRGIIEKNNKSLLSVNCLEFENVENVFIENGWTVKHFPKINTIDKKDKIFAKHFLEEISKDKTIIGAFEFQEFNFFELIKNRVNYFSQDLNSILKYYNKLNSYMEKNKFDIVFFHTLTPFKPEGVLLPLICQNKKIPYVCWTHGAAGNNKTLSGYKFSDHLFGQHYFVYGEVYRKLLNEFHSNFKLITHTIGSAILNKRYLNYKAPNNKRKIITVVVGPTANKNLHHLFDDKYYRFDYYFPLKKVLEVLSKYSKKYKIIIRLHNDDKQKYIINNILKLYNVQDIELMDTKEISFDKVVKFSDLFINFWLSTTFYEQCFSHADIFMLNESDLTRQTKETLTNRAYYFENFDSFTKNLNKYLDEGIFYKKSKDKSFLINNLDWERRNSISKNALNIVENILR